MNRGLNDKLISSIFSLLNTDRTEGRVNRLLLKSTVSRLLSIRGGTVFRLRFEREREVTVGGRVEGRVDVV